MRGILVLLPFALLAQAPPARPAAAKPAAAKPAAVKPAAAKPAAVKPAGAAKTAAVKPAAAPVALTTDDEKTVYALGLSMHRVLAQFALSPAELAIIKQAVDDAAAGKPAVEINEWGPKIDAFGRARAGQRAKVEKAASLAYLDKVAAEPGCVRTESGIVYRELTPGTGPSPAASDTVKVHYRGTLINGTEFDSSYKRNEPAEFPLTGVIKCWTEGVQKMKVGGKSVLMCPSDLAYGDAGRPTIPGGAALIFEIELLEIKGPAGAR